MKCSNLHETLCIPSTSRSDPCANITEVAPPGAALAKHWPVDLSCKQGSREVFPCWECCACCWRHEAVNSLCRNWPAGSWAAAMSGKQLQHCRSISKMPAMCCRRDAEHAPRPGSCDLTLHAGYVSECHGHLLNRQTSLQTLTRWAGSHGSDSWQQLSPDTFKQGCFADQNRSLPCRRWQHALAHGSHGLLIKDCHSHMPSNFNEKT